MLIKQNHVSLALIIYPHPILATGPFQLQCNLDLVTTCGPFILQPRFLQFEIWGLRNLVGEIWFEKSGSRKVVDQKKRWFYTINPTFFRFEKSGWPEKKIRVCRTTFLEPLFYTFLEKWSQNKWSSGPFILVKPTYYQNSNHYWYQYRLSDFLIESGFHYDYVTQNGPYFGRMINPTYRIVASSNTSHLEAHGGFFRLLMKGFFYPYVAFDKKLMFWLVMGVRTCNHSLFQLACAQITPTNAHNIGLSPIQSFTYPGTPKL